MPNDSNEWDYDAEMIVNKRWPRERVVKVQSDEDVGGLGNATMQPALHSFGFSIEVYAMCAIK